MPYVLIAALIFISTHPRSASAADAFRIIGSLSRSTVRLNAPIAKSTHTEIALGSGVIFSTEKWIYIVTASHVVDGKDVIHALFYSEEIQKDVPGALRIDTRTKTKKKTIFTGERDLTAFRIGRFENNELHLVENVRSIITKETMRFDPSNSYVFGKMIVASKEKVKFFDDVPFAEEALILGFPSSLNNYRTPGEVPYDDSSLLIRRGMVAGKNSLKRLLLLDGMVFPGNSGGPVFSIPRPFSGEESVLIGIIQEFVPYTSISRDERGQQRSIDIQNSGYAVAEPVDGIIDLLDEADLQ